MLSSSIIINNLAGLLVVTSLMVGSEGTSYIIRVMTSSRMARRPRAPMPRWW